MISSFSGGRTSAYMTRKLQQAGLLKHSVFMNTGAEDDRTLDFVNECDKRWGLGVIWLEAVVHHGELTGCTHKVVTYETASRSYEPFEDIVSKYGIPNKSHPHCNRELKLNPFNSWKRENAKGMDVSIGIRVDEMDRQAKNAKKNNLIYPLISMFPTFKADVMAFWEGQNFCLDLPEHYGNCVTCWKKSDRKLKTLALENSSLFDEFMDYEVLYEHANAENNSGKFFRGNTSTPELIASSLDTFEVFRDRLFPQESDLPNGCGETCDLFTDD